MPIKTKNHFLPVCYQKQWYTRINSSTGLAKCFVWNKQAALFNIRSGEINHGNNRTWQNRLYWLNSNNMNRKLSLENEFERQLENPVARIFSKLEKKDIYSINSHERMKLVLFAIYLAVRSPNIVNDLKTNTRVRESENLLKYVFLKNGGTIKEYYELTASSFFTDIINNFNLDTILDRISDDDSNIQFITERFGKKALVTLCDTSKSKFKLLTSNYPVIHGRNMFSKIGYDLVFPISPTKVLLIISDISREAYESIKYKDVNYLPQMINIGMFNNHRGRDLVFDYEIYSATADQKEILPKVELDRFF